MEKINTKQGGLNVIAIGLAGLLVLAAGTASAQRSTNVVSNLQSDTTVTPAWQPQYDFKVAAGANGSVSGTANGWHDEGTTISNTATANRHYRFLNWSGAPSGASNDNPIVFGLNRAITNLTANFGLTNYTVTIVSTHPWFGTNVIGNPAIDGVPGTSAAAPAFSSPTTSVDTIVVDTNNAGRRLRYNGANIQ